MPALCQGKLILYGTSACHLCELAEQLLQSVMVGGAPIVFEKVDISESDELFERFGVKIPVIRCESGAELCWPFGQAELECFLRDS